MDRLLPLHPFKLRVRSCRKQCETKPGFEPPTSTMMGMLDELQTEAVSIAMTQNVFQFGDANWIQTCGAAMGTSAACALATIWCSCHKETTTLPTHGNSGPLLFHKRFADDGFSVWKPAAPCASFDRFKSDLCFGKLTWTAAAPSRSVDFLDLTLSISNGSNSSKTCTKENNLHLCLPPSSTWLQLSGNTCLSADTALKTLTPSSQQPHTALTQPKNGLAPMPGLPQSCSSTGNTTQRICPANASGPSSTQLHA